MTTSSTSPSEAATSFDRLHPAVRRWIWNKGWSQLRDVQDRTIPSIMDRTGDTLVIAGTASGKTEAAFLPVLSVVAERKKEGVSVLYVSPLKALINDQFGRLDELCDDLGINVVRWHGDAPQSAKQALVRNPSGIALITPESIEALLVRRPERARALFADIDFIVVDEVHAFLNSVRGLHLRSLLGRVATMSAKRPRMVGLSATVGDPDAAATWINPDNPADVDIVVSTAGNPEVRLSVRGYVDADDLVDPDALEAWDEEAGQEDGHGRGKVALDYIADDLFKVTRGHNNLVFAGSRRRVEALTDRLRTRCEKAAVPNEYFAHHGSLSKELREPLEKRLKEGVLPTTASATTTLELGIDIGSVRTVAQVGPPRSMSSLRQRLGRSGRREGVPAILRMYIRERRIGPKTHPFDRLRLNVVAAVASVVLLGRKYVEKPDVPPGAATVALQQTLSVVAERNGATVADLYSTVCSGPMSVVGKDDYIALLRHMAREEGLLEQAPDGTVMLGSKGERLVGSRDFFAVFETDEEWRVVSGGKTLGSLPLINLVKPGSFIAFAGQRWRVETVQPEGKVLEVVRDRSAKIPSFEAMGREGVSGVFAEAMREVLAGDDVPAFLDGNARQLLFEGRAAFAVNGLADRAVWEEAGGACLLTWAGTAANEMLALVLMHLGYEASAEDIGVLVAGVTGKEAMNALASVATSPPAPMEVVKSLEGLASAKFDSMVPHGVLESQWAKRNARAYDEALAIARRLALSSEAKPSWEL